MKRWSLTTAAALGLAASTSSSAMQLDLERPELCRISDAVVVATVTDIDTHWTPGPDGKIERHAFVVVESTLHGPSLSGAVVVLPGGTLGDLSYWVEDVPDLRKGERYALFLGAVEGGFEVYGGDLGAIEIADDVNWKGETVDHVRKTLEGCDAQ